MGINKVIKVRGWTKNIVLVGGQRLNHTLNCDELLLVTTQRRKRAEKQTG